MLEYFLIFPDRKNVGEHNCYLEDCKCRNVITEAHSYHPVAHIRYQTWQRVNDLNLPELSRGSFPGISSWRLPWSLSLGFYDDQDSRVWSLMGKPRQFSCYCLFTCQYHLESSSDGDMTPKQHILAWMLPSLFPLWIWETTKNLRSWSPLFLFLFLFF